MTLEEARNYEIPYMGFPLGIMKSNRTMLSEWTDITVTQLKALMLVRGLPELDLGVFDACLEAIEERIAEKRE